MFINDKNGIFRLLTLIFVLIPSVIYAGEFHLFQENGKQGLKNNNNEVVIPAQYEKLGWSDGSFSIKEDVTGYYIDGKWGLIHIDNKVVTVPLYQTLSIQNSGHFIIAEIAGNDLKKDKLGLIDRQGNVIISFSYIKIEVYRDRIIAYLKNEGKLPKVGLINAKEEIIIPFDYQLIKPLGSLRFIAEKSDGRFEMFNDNGGEVAKFEVDSVGVFNQGYAPFWVEHRMGWLNLNGEIEINPKYAEIRKNDIGLESLDFSKWIDRSISSNEVIELYYENVVRVNDSVFHVSANHHHWLINNRLEKIQNKAYDSIGIFNEGFAVFKKDGKFGVMNSNAKVIVPPVKLDIKSVEGFYYVQNANMRWDIYDRFGVKKNVNSYDDIGPPDRIFFPVKKGGFWGLINRSGEELIYCVFDSLSVINSDKIAVKFKGLFGIIDIKGNWLVSPNEFPKTVINDQLYFDTKGKQTRVRSFSGELIYFTDNPLTIYDQYFVEALPNGNVWRISFSGVIQSQRVSDVVPLKNTQYSEFEAIYPPSEGYYPIKKEGRFGFIDELNRLRIANRYDSLIAFSEGLAPFKLRGKWGYIDKDENIIIQPTYDMAEQFENGVARVLFNGKYNIIHRDNRMQFNTGFETMDVLDQSRYMVSQNGQFGIINESGKVLINYVFDQLIDLKNGYYIVEKLGRMGVVDQFGMYVIPRDYDLILYEKSSSKFLLKTNSNWKPLQN